MANIRNFSLRTFSRANVFILGMIVFLLFVLLFNKPWSEGIVKRITTLQNVVADTSWQYRMKHYSRYVDLGLKRPFLGYGYGKKFYAFGEETSLYSNQTTSQVDNAFITIFVLSGILGLVGLFNYVLAIGIFVYRNIKRVASQDAKLLLQLVFLCYWGYVFVSSMASAHFLFSNSDVAFLGVGILYIRFLESQKSASV